MTTAVATKPDKTKQVHAWDYKEFRAKYAPWAPDTTDAVTQDIVVRIWEPTGSRGLNVPTGSHLYGVLFFPKLKKKFTDKRLEYLVLLDDQTIPWINAIGHRGFGKTTLATIWAERQILARFSRHVLYTSSEYKLAVKRTDAMRTHITDADIRNLFGNFRPKRNNKVSANFSEETWTLVDPKTGQVFACVNPRGSNQTVNGSLVLMGNEWVRVDLILNDDGQSRKNIHNEDVRRTYEEWLDDELAQTVDIDEQPDPIKNRWELEFGQRAPWRNVMFDTVKHRNCVAIKYRKRKHWAQFFAPLAKRLSDGTYVTAHPGYMTDAQVQALHERNKYKPTLWSREFLCEPMSREEQQFTEDLFIHVNAEQEMQRRRGLIKFLIVDPARVGKKTASNTSILAVAVDVTRGQIVLRKNLVGQWQPEIYYQKIFETCREMQTTKVYMEDTGLSAVLHNAIETAASLAGLYGQIEFEWLHSKRHPGVEYGNGDNAIKVARSGELLPYYRQKLVLHDQSMEGQSLESNLLEWPECSSWDATDTAGYIPEVLDREGIYLESDIEDAGFIDGEESEEYEQACRYMASGAWKN